MPALSDCRVQQIEQQLPDACRSRRLDGKHQAINIKLDKTGGLTEALALAAEAKRRGLRIMVGGVTSTSLGVAPARKTECPFG